jgi:hypothetical protein
MNIDRQKIKALLELCEHNQVKSLFAFGSVTRNDFNEKSDIDLVIEFNESDPFKYADLYFNFKSQAETILKRQIDLLEERAIKNALFRDQLEKTKVKIYGS